MLILPLRNVPVHSMTAEEETTRPSERITPTHCKGSN